MSAKAFSQSFIERYQAQVSGVSLEDFKKRLTLARNACYRSFTSMPENKLMTFHHILDELTLLCLGRLAYVLYKYDGDQKAYRYYNFLRDPCLKFKLEQELERIESERQTLPISTLFPVYQEQTSKPARYYLLPFIVNFQDKQHKPLSDIVSFAPVYSHTAHDNGSFSAFVYTATLQFFKIGSFDEGYIIPVHRYLERINDYANDHPQIAFNHKTPNNEGVKNAKLWQKVLNYLNGVLPLNSIDGVYQQKENILSNSRWQNDPKTPADDCSSNVFFFVRHYGNGVARYPQDGKGQYDYSAQLLMPETLLKKYHTILTRLKANKEEYPHGEKYSSILQKGDQYYTLAQAVDAHFWSILTSDEANNSGISKLLEMLAQPYSQHSKSLVDRVFTTGLATVLYPFGKNAGLHRISGSHTVKNYNDLDDIDKIDYLKLACFYYLCKTFCPSTLAQDHYIALLNIPIEVGSTTWMVFSHAFVLPFDGAYKNQTLWYTLFDFHDCIGLSIARRVRAEVKSLYLYLLSKVYSDMYTALYNKYRQDHQTKIEPTTELIEPINHAYDALARCIPFNVVHCTLINSYNFMERNNQGLIRLGDQQCIRIELKPNPYFPSFNGVQLLKLEEVTNAINFERNRVIIEYGKFVTANQNDPRPETTDEK